MSLLVRAETAADHAAIETLTASAFLSATHSSGTEQFIVNALRRAGRLSLSLVAQDGADIVGHVAVSPVEISPEASGWYGLGPISVLPGRQREGIGSRLMRAALTELERIGASGCVLLGDPAYYRRFGFAVRPGLTLPGVPPEYFQALCFHGRWAEGSVRYHEAFEATA